MSEQNTTESINVTNRLPCSSEKSMSFVHSLSGALTEMQNKGLPVVDFARINPNITTALHEIKSILNEKRVVTITDDEMLRASGPSPTSVLLPGTTDPEILKAIRNFEGHSILRLCPPRDFLKSHTGIILVEPDGNAVIDLAKTFADYHDISEGKKVSSHSLVVRPGNFPRSIKNVPNNGFVETNISTTHVVLQTLKENEHLDALFELSRDFGPFAASFVLRPGNKIEFFHPVVGTKISQQHSE